METTFLSGATVLKILWLWRQTVSKIAEEAFLSCAIFSERYILFVFLGDTRVQASKENVPFAFLACAFGCAEAEQYQLSC